MNKGNNTSQDKGFTDQLFNRIEDQNLSYSKMSEDEKQKYWIGVIAKVFHDLEDGEKINISEYRETEPNIDLFLNSIIENIESYHWEDRITIISKYFILDEKAKMFLDSKLIENLGDLYYNTLADFLEELYKITGNEKLKIASEKIKIAWNISEQYVDKNNPPKKHENAESQIRFLGGINTVAQKIGNLGTNELGKFLLTLSEKIWNDGEKDSNRLSIRKDGVVDETKKRTRLATSLIESSLLLKEVGNSLSNIQKEL